MLYPSKYRFTLFINLPGSRNKPVAHQLLSSTSSRSAFEALKFLTY